MYCISIDVLYANEKGIIIYGYIAYICGLSMSASW